MCVILKVNFFCSNKILDFLLVGRKKVNKLINFSQNSIWKDKSSRSVLFFSLNYYQLELNSTQQVKDNAMHATEYQMDGFGLRLDFLIWSKIMKPNWNPAAYHYTLLKIKNEIYSS